MTREEVRQQLAKNPLVWKNREAELVMLTQWLEMKYSIDWRELSVEMCSPEECIVDYIASSNDDNELKSKAEAHRLDFICRLLGINEQQIESSINGNKTEDLLLNRIVEIERIVDRAEDQVDDIIEEYGDNPSIGSDKVTVVFSKIREAISQIKSVAVSPRTQGVKFKE